MTRNAPAVQDFAGFLKVLNPSLGAMDRCLVLLYQRGTEGAEYRELEQWAHPRMTSNLRRTLSGIVDDKSFAHRDGDGRYFITMSGQQEVEVRKLVQPKRPK